jgi:hypothetical protein
MTNSDPIGESEALADSIIPGDDLVAELDAAATLLRRLRASLCAESMADDELLAVTAAVAEVAQACDAIQVVAAGEIHDRSRSALGSDRLSARKGCRSASELLQRVTRVSSVTASRLLRVGEAVRTTVSFSGASVPPRFAVVGAALESGGLCLDAAGAIVGGLSLPSLRADADAVAAAEEELVDAALGASPECPVAATADELRLQAAVWRTLIDPDGVVPDEERAMRHRSLTLGRATSSGVTLAGVLLPEAAARLQRIFDAYLSPVSRPVAFPASDPAPAADADNSDNSDPTDDSDPTENSGQTVGNAEDGGIVDTRTRAQQQHDVFLSMLDHVGRSNETPTIGGASPAVVVSVRQSDLEAGTGVGWVEGTDVPVSQRTVRQSICTGGAQRIVLSDAGRILELGTEQRCFNGRQRRAITLRDGGCIIPGCRVPASWCEIHHTTPFAEGGATHTDIGVLLCWFHHRTIEHSGWEIRMHGGAPQIKAPPWLDRHHRSWVPATTSRTRLADLRQHRRDGSNS